MGAFGQLAGGFAAALSPLNLAMALVGALLGTLVGVLPGLGPTSALAILIPLTAVLPPEAAIIMMAGIYYGAQYGGSTTAILLNIPGEVSSVPSTLDGYALARRGMGGPALGIAAIGSFIAGTIGVIALTFFAPLLAKQALRFGPPEYFGLMVLALTVIVGLSGSSMLKALIAGCFGYVLSLAGLGLGTGMPRFYFGIRDLYGGFDVISLVIGLFAVSEILAGLEETRQAIAPQKIGRVFPTLAELRETIGSMLRGTLSGFFLGLLPGCAPAVTTFLAYDIEKKSSRHPERFGKGALEGVAAPESANNATSSAGFIPLMALGVPASPPLAVLLGGLLIYGLQPGPMLFQKDPHFVWTVIASMYIGNVMLLVLNLPLVGLWARLTTVPYGLLAPIILILCVVGGYTVRNSMFDVVMCLVFGVMGYFMRKYDWPTAPVVLCFILGPLLEKSLLQSLGMSHGSFSIFVSRPICLGLLVVAAVLLVVSLRLRRSRVVPEGESDVMVQQSQSAPEQG